MLDWGTNPPTDNIVVELLWTDKYGTTGLMAFETILTISGEPMTCITTQKGW